MAGFALVMEFLTLGLVALVASTVASLFLFFYLKRQGRPKAARAGAVAPFLASLWILVAFLIHVQVSNHLAHQDCGFSPDPFVTLPNGYVLGSANTYDGYIHAPGFQTDVPVSGPGYVRSLIDLDLDNGIFTGTLLDLNTSVVRQFTLDTRTHELHLSNLPPWAKPHRYDSKESLNAFGIAQTHVHEDSNGYWVMYDQYRHHWPNFVFLMLILAGEVTIAFWLSRRWNVV